MTDQMITNGVHEDCKHKMPSAIKNSLMARDGVWKDVSWGNDEFASFTNEENGWVLRLSEDEETFDNKYEEDEHGVQPLYNKKNPALEYDEYRGCLLAFNVVDNEVEEGDLSQSYESDDLEMLAQIASHPTPRARAWKHFINSKQPVFVEDTDTVIDGWKVKVFKSHFGGNQLKTPVDKYFYLFNGDLKGIDPDDESTWPPHINVEKQSYKHGI